MSYRQGKLAITLASYRDAAPVAALLRVEPAVVTDDMRKGGSHLIATYDDEIIGYKGPTLEGVKGDKGDVVQLLRSAADHTLIDPYIGGCEK